MVTISVKEKREKSVLRRHPWLFTGAVHRVEGTPQDGEEVRVLDQRGAFLARGLYAADSQICCRLYRWEDEAIDTAFWTNQIRRVTENRTRLLNETTNACRLVNAEGDGLPGLVIDRYDRVFVMQCGTAGTRRWKTAIAEFLAEAFNAAAVVEKSEGREKTGTAETQAPSRRSKQEAVVEIVENGLKYRVDILHGQKTGFYLDQRENRALIRSVAQGRKVLDCFSYTGAFAVSALAGGAEKVTCVDASRTALKLAQENTRANGFALPEEAFVQANVFEYLRQCETRFDLIVLDPPALAKHRRDTQSGARAYKDVNMQAMQKLTPGGLLLTCSCSQHISPDLFQKIVFSAAYDSRRHACILQERSHALDHPINIYHPEGRYLHAFLLRID